MCTLTYLPLANSEFILTSNRDESPLRAVARKPEIRRIGEQEVVFPVDGQAGGTWIAAANNRRTVCLLNGAFARHQMGGTYRLSRGVMVLESFGFDDLAAFAAEYEFGGIEPFTFVGVDDERILEMRWDGTELHQQAYDAAKPQIWSSAQLYKPEIIQRREAWFREWLEQHPDYRLADAQAFHQFGGEGDVYNDIRMNRNNMVRTVSTTAIENERSRVRMHYADLLNGENVVETLPLL